MGRKGTISAQEWLDTPESWMDRDILVAAAVRAVKENRSLSWKQCKRTDASIPWDDFKRAAVWVTRYRKQRQEHGVDLSKLLPFSDSALKSFSKAAIALRDADLGREPLKNMPTFYRASSHGPASVETVTEGLKGFGLQILWMLAIVPLGLIFGLNYGGGFIAVLILPVAFGLGILILLFRFFSARVSAAQSGKPMSKKWYE